MRSGAGTEFDVVQGVAPQTEGVVIGESEDGAWTQVRLEDGTEGWIATQLLRFETRLIEVEATATATIEPSPAPATEQPATATPISETETATPTPAPPTATLTPTPAPPTATPTPATVTIGIVNADTAVNVREEPNGAVLAVARPGDELLVIGQNEDESWTQVRLPDGREGWIASFLLIFEERPAADGDAALPRIIVVYGRSRLIYQDTQPEPTEEATAETTAEATEPAATPTLAPSPTPSPTPTVAVPSARIDEQAERRWYGMTFGLMVAIVVIAFGGLYNLLRALLRRGRS